MSNGELDKLTDMFWQDMTIDWVNFSELVEWVREVPPHGADRGCLEQGVEYVFRALLAKGSTMWAGSSDPPSVHPFPATEPDEVWSLALADWRSIGMELYPGHVGMLRRLPETR